MGMENLRQTKLSYKPVKMAERNIRQLLNKGFSQSCFYDKIN